jgi:hypothetical protein
MQIKSFWMLLLSIFYLLTYIGFLLFLLVVTSLIVAIFLVFTGQLSLWVLEKVRNTPILNLEYGLIARPIKLLYPWLGFFMLF